MRNEIQVRHGLKFCCVESLERPAVMIKFCPWKATEWLLPWSRFEYSSFVPEEECERMELSFPHHKVTILGYSLRELEKEISIMHVRCVRDLPESHYSAFEPKEPFIKRLEVRLLADLQNPSAGELPF